MSNHSYLPFRCFGIVSLLVLQLMVAAASARAACYTTPRIAINAVLSTSAPPEVSTIAGFQVTKIESDQVLGHRWATLITCGHPDWPAFAVPVSSSESLIVSRGAQQPVIQDVRAASVVRAGQSVLLWRQEDSLRIEIVGIAEENGGLGKRIRVRLVHTSGDPSTLQQLAGIVRGPSNVEIQP
jgi:Chaperone for flagella basal body P-ring formation